MKLFTYIYRFFIYPYSSLIIGVSASLFFFSSFTYGAVSLKGTQAIVTNNAVPSVDLSIEEMDTNHFPEFDSANEYATDAVTDFEALSSEDKRTLVSQLRVTHIFLKRENGEHCLVDPVNNNLDLVPDFVEVASEASPMDLSLNIPICNSDEVSFIQEVSERFTLEPLQVAVAPLAVAVIGSLLTGFTVGCGVELFVEKNIRSRNFEKNTKQTRKYDDQISHNPHMLIKVIGGGQFTREIRRDNTHTTSLSYTHNQVDTVKSSVDSGSSNNESFLDGVMGIFDCGDITYFVQ